MVDGKQDNKHAKKGGDVRPTQSKRHKDLGAALGAVSARKRTALARCPYRMTQQVLLDELRLAYRALHWMHCKPNA